MLGLHSCPRACSTCGERGSTLQLRRLLFQWPLLLQSMGLNLCVPSIVSWILKHWTTSEVPNLEYLKPTCAFQRRTAVTLDWRIEKGDGGTWRGSTTLALGCWRVNDQPTNRAGEQEFAREGGGAFRFWCVCMRLLYIWVMALSSQG